MFGNVAPDCVWVGTITITGNDGGSVEQPEVGSDRTITWMFDYEAALSIQDDGQGLATLDGTLTLSVLLPTGTDLTGTTRTEATGSCGSGGSSDIVKPASAFYASGTASASAFSGSESVDQSYFDLPQGGFAEMVMSWDLRLVRR